MSRLLMVCTGNVCRSPMAAAMFSHAFPDFDVMSMGTHAMVGAPVDDRAQQVLMERGIEFGQHQAQQLTGPACHAADLILVMERMHQWWIEGVWPYARGRVFPLLARSGDDVVDPYGGSVGEFRLTLSQIEQGLDYWTPRIGSLAC
jgi:protein-tyrosine phosphatase